MNTYLGEIERNLRHGTDIRQVDEIVKIGSGRGVPACSLGRGVRVDHVCVPFFQAIATADNIPTTNSTPTRGVSGFDRADAHLSPDPNRPVDSA